MVQEDKVLDANKCSPELENELKGMKLKFGNKIVDPKDQRICRPHHRVIDNNGLLHTEGHRKTTDKN
ncbi:hypothetical protein DAMA08_027290 [Martiniozyma asiatica (nom. inval.)]|nr:hypothetical protein DAMA08_027290 [Martiniozyma asiatica]